MLETKFPPKERRSHRPRIAKKCRLAIRILRLPADSELAVSRASTGDFSGVGATSGAVLEVAMRRAPNPPTDADIDALLDIFQPRCPVPLNREDGREIYESLDALFCTLRELSPQRERERGAA